MRSKPLLERGHRAAMGEGDIPAMGEGDIPAMGAGVIPPGRPFGAPSAWQVYRRARWNSP